MSDELLGRTGPDLVRQPIRNGSGASILGPRNPSREAENPNILSPPRTDHGSMPNLRWSLADSRMRLEEGGWARQTTVRELPIATEIAGVNTRLKAGAVRELHFHKEGEWAYMLKGRARVTAPARSQDLGPASPWLSYRMLAQEPHRTTGGTLRVVDSSNFEASNRIAAALVEVEPGGLRELHWHANADEWQYCISGQARMTVFGSSGKRQRSTTRRGTSVTCRAACLTTSRTPARARCGFSRPSGVTTMRTIR
jgi:oxalate decarboxylase/phosphoglucose isomerase-like protein (cupin superfamily)